MPMLRELMCAVSLRTFVGYYLSDAGVKKIADDYWMITAALCALPAHEAAHQAVDAAGRLGAVEAWTLSPALAWLVTYWPGLGVLVFALVMHALARSGRLRPIG